MRSVLVLLFQNLRLSMRSRAALADFFVVPTVTYRLLFVLVILGHERRRVVHVGVTAHPTAWTAQQLREAFPEDTAPRFLIHDRDTAFAELSRTAPGMAIEEVITACRSPWQNAYAERLIGSIRREWLDHVIILSETGLRGIFTMYVTYYHEARTHLSLQKDTPWPRAVAPPVLGSVGRSAGRRSPSPQRPSRRVGTRGHVLTRGSLRDPCVERLLHSRTL
jgi:transposase InsO family protein